MKAKDWLALSALTLFSLWIGRDLLRPELISSHDGIYHVVRLSQFHQALVSGQFPVRWAPGLLGGLGYPLFIVNYHLPYYLAEALHLTGLSLFSSIEAVFLISIIGTSVTSYLFFRSWSKDYLAAFVGSVFFAVAPYRLANIFERGALGEALAYMFIPLLFLGIHQLTQKKSATVFVIGLAGLLLSHAVIAIIFLPLSALYLILFSKDKKSFSLFFLGTIISFMLSAFQLAPALFERRFMNFDQQLLTAYQGHFKSIFQILRIPKEGINIGTRFQVGLSHSLVILISIFLGIKAKNSRKKNLYFFFVLASLGALLLITDSSRSLWQNLFPLKLVLYPWRFLGLTAFSSSVLTVLIISSQKRYKIITGIFLLVIVLFTNRHYVRADAFEPAVFPDQMLSGNGTTQNEFDPKNFSIQAKNFSQPAIEPLDVPVKLSNLTQSPFDWTFTIESNRPNRIKLGLLYFPGWQASLNGLPIKIEDNLQIKSPQPKDLRGLIVLNIPSGTHQVKVSFRETPLRLAGNLITAVTLLFIVATQFKKRSTANQRA